MRDDGHRLVFSISDDKFYINDNVESGLIIYANKTFSSLTLDRQVVIQHIKNLTEALSTYSPVRKLISNMPVLSNTATLIVREDKHYEWTISYDSQTAVVKDNTITMTRTFDVTAVLRRINKVYSMVLAAKNQFAPKRAVIRQIADAKLLVWYKDDNTAVCYIDDVQGSLIRNCLINGVYYWVVYVSVSEEQKRVTLYNNELKEITWFPLDDSVLRYFTADEHVFDAEIAEVR